MRLRTNCTLNHRLERSLLAYVNAATAAGVGLMALSQPAEAKIVYTATHQVIGPNTTYQLDLNNDGKTDFTFQNLQLDSSELLYLASQAKQNGVYGFSFRSVPYAHAPKAGIRIGPNARFVYGNRVFMIDGNATQACHGTWNNVKHHYLGLKFLVGQNAHYGWARLNVTCEPSQFKIKAVLTGYAYQTKANKAIVTGDTGAGASLGRLAAGVAAGK